MSPTTEPDDDGREPSAAAGPGDELGRRLRSARHALERLGVELEDTTRVLDEALEELSDDERDDGDGPDDDAGPPRH